MLEEGRYGSIREMAAAEGVDRAYVGRVLNLTLLAPDLVEKVLNGSGQDRSELSRVLCGLPDIWTTQRAAARGG
jgi:hypothetical protein